MGARQNVSWRRDQAGRMQVVLNDKLLLEAVDAGAHETYRRLAVINRGGDYAVRRVALAGPANPATAWR